MTHAALKDHEARTEDVQTLREILLDYGDDEAGPRYTMERRALNAAIAALSAMEGEAAVEILGWNDNASPRLRFLTKVGRLTAGTILYTAPPPQQADEVTLDASKVTITEGDWTGTYSEWLDKHGIRPKGSCRLCDCTGDIHDQTGEWRGECPYCKPATHPTPSPGPQGGGKDWRQVRADEIERDIGLRGMTAQQVFTQMRQLIATPPAHQPGEVGELKAENRRLRDALAKIEGLLSAALAPKEDGHG